MEFDSMHPMTQGTRDEIEKACHYVAQSIFDLDIEDKEDNLDGAIAEMDELAAEFIETADFTWREMYYCDGVDESLLVPTVRFIGDWFTQPYWGDVLEKDGKWFEHTLLMLLNLVQPLSTYSQMVGSQKNIEFLDVLSEGILRIKKEE